MGFFNVSMMAETGIKFGIVFAFFAVIGLATFFAVRKRGKDVSKHRAPAYFPRIDEVDIKSESIKTSRVLPLKWSDQNPPEMRSNKVGVNRIPSINSISSKVSTSPISRQLGGTTTAIVIHCR